MCVVAAIPLALAVAATAYSAVNSYQQGKAQAASFQTQAQLYDNQAQIAKDSAALQQASIARTAAQTSARQAALFSSAGVTLDGTPTDVLSTTAGEYGRQIYDTQFGSNAKVASLQADSANSLTSASNSAAEGVARSTGTLLNFGTNAAFTGGWGLWNSTVPTTPGSTASPGLTTFNGVPN